MGSSIRSRKILGSKLKARLKKDIRKRRMRALEGKTGHQFSISYQSLKELRTQNFESFFGSLKIVLH